MEISSDQGNKSLGATGNIPGAGTSYNDSKSSW